MIRSLTRKLIDSHRAGGGPCDPGQEIALEIDQTLAQDATGTLVMLTLEALDVRRVATELSAQYVDHNLLQTDSKNGDDHLYLESACKRFGVHFSRPGNGVSHPVHMELFGRPGKTLLGSDSHTCAAGSLGMLAIGAGGLDVAMAMAGHPFYLRMPRVWGVYLTGTLPEWVSAKDVVLEMLRRHGVRGARDWVLEYFGPGVATLSAMDRHVIANMGAELGATTSVFPSDDRTREFLARSGREEAWTELRADPDARFDRVEQIDLGSLYPLIATPSSPGNVVAVREVEGQPIYQAYIGSSANPGFRDFAIAADMLAGKEVAPGVSFDINPSSRSVLADLVDAGYLWQLLQAGARIHQAGCNGCIGMGQAPATGRISLRTVPRNFPGRSGAREDSVFLCSPETATASAITGRITDPRDLGLSYPKIREPVYPASTRKLVLSPLEPSLGATTEIVRGPNIAQLPELDPLPESLDVEIVLKVGDDVSTDEILPAGAEALALRSNIPKIAEYCFAPIDARYVSRARSALERGGHAVLGGANYGQGSSREHAALAPRYLGLRLVLAKSYARIHLQNLVNYGVLPLTFARTEEYDALQAGMRLRLESARARVGQDQDVQLQRSDGAPVAARLALSDREREILLAGGLVAWARRARIRANVELMEVHSP